MNLPIGSADTIVPPMTLRGANAVDSYSIPPPFDAELDLPTPEYLEKHFWGIAHLDPASWRYYLPILTHYALTNISNASNAVDAFLASLRPPDREPPRLGSLSKEQESVVIALLDRLAFDSESVWTSQAMIALEELWAPGALYKHAP
jgi:hypothetical protein